MKTLLLACLISGVTFNALAADIEASTGVCADRAITALIQGVERHDHVKAPANAREQLKAYREDFKKVCGMIYSQGAQSRQLSTVKPERAQIRASIKAASLAGGQGKDALPEDIADDLAGIMTETFFDAYNAK